MSEEDITEAGATLESQTVYAWDEEPEQEPRWRITDLLRDGRIIPAVIAAVAVAAVSVAATLALTPGPDHFTIRPAPIEQVPPPKPAAPAPEAVAPAPPAAPAPASRPVQHVPAPVQAAPQSPPNAHQAFTQALRGDTRETQNGAGLYPTNPAAVDSEAEQMCQDLANGGSIQPYITGTERKSSTLAPWQAAEVVHQAIQAYCPQYLR
jgi:hypothetical protein